MGKAIQDIQQMLQQGQLVPCLGAGALAGVVNDRGQAIPADNTSLILGMTGGQAMAPRLMHEFSRAAMHMENKKGRKFIEMYLTQIYAHNVWTRSPLHSYLASLNLPYIIDFNRDTQLQELYSNREHTLVVGAARLAGVHYRFNIYQFINGHYRRIEQSQVNPHLPVLFKPMGTPKPEASYIASDADYVDYITELMGGFAIPEFLKKLRLNKQYLILGLNFDKDTERMITTDIIYGAAEPAGWLLNDEPSAKDKKFCAKRHLQLLQQPLSVLLN
jgi:hypothetical protein